jgi:membrane protease YdiL (CAAX protease family)
MKEFIRINNWWFYFVLTYFISWSLWGLGSNILPPELHIISLIVGSFGPFLAAVIMLRISMGKTGLKDWLKSLFNFRIPVSWYLLSAIVFPFASALLHHLIYLMLGGQSGAKFGLDWLTYFAYLIPTAMFTGGNEEPGWRGYITPVLMRKMHPIVVSIVVGISWAFWHFPLYYLAWGGSDQPILWLMIYTIPLSMILTWLYYKPRRSIIPAMLFHAAGNVVFQYFPMQTQVLNSMADAFTVIKAIVYWIFAIILLIATRGNLGKESSERKL